MTTLELQFRLEHNPPYFWVRLHSIARPNLVTRGRVWIKDHDANRITAQTVAGALAEIQCEKYGDTHDPSEVAHKAGEIYDISSKQQESAGLRF